MRSTGSPGVECGITPSVPRQVGPQGRIVYVAGNLPGRSQTFVYQEIVGLRAAGVRVAAVTARANPFTTSLAAELGGVHALSGPGFVREALRGLLVSPREALIAVRELAAGPFPSARERLKTGFHVILGLSLAAHVRRIGAGYVHAHHFGMASTAAFVAARVCRVPFGFTAHGSDMVAPVLLRQVAGAASVVVAASEYIRYRLAEQAPDVAPRVRVVRCGVPLERFASSPRRVAHEHLRLLHVGSLLEPKDHDTLLAAARDLRRAGVPFELRLVGEGPRRAAIERRIRAHGLVDHVTLVGALANHELPALYEWADVFVLSSRREGLPVVLVEALASGLAVVSTNVGGIPELIRDGVEGFLVPPGDSSALAGAVVRLRDPQLRRQMGRRGTERVSVHDLTSVATTLRDLFPIVPLDHESMAPRGASFRPRIRGAPAIERSLQVSVVIPAHNDDGMIGRALASVAAQRPRLPAEVIVVDDSSTDGTASVAADLGASVIRHGRKQGAAAARNTGIAAATQPWVALLDTNDEWLPHHLATLWELREGHVLATGAVIHRVRQNRPDRVTHRALKGRPLPIPRAGVLPRNLVSRSATIVRRSVLEEIVGCDTGLPLSEDYDLWISVLEHGTGVVSPTPVSVCDDDAESARGLTASRAVRGGRAQEAPGRRFLLRHPARLAAVLGGSVRSALELRRSGAVAGDGGPSVAILAVTPAQRVAALHLLAGRPAVDLGRCGSRICALVRLLRRPTSMAFVSTSTEALLVRLIGVRPLWPDRGEHQLRSTRYPLDDQPGEGKRRAGVASFGQP